jgi:diadenosine tetraphosphate (Ap4A) HIT family hydrolase
MTSFELDARLAGDTLTVGELPLCTVRLMNDTRWPWLVLVPRIPEASEIHDLCDDTQIQLARETALIAAQLKRISGCQKINSAAIGNIVSQLHVHVIARTVGDPNWPAPVWGYGQKVPYDGVDADRFVSQFRPLLESWSNNSQNANSRMIS